MHSYTQLQQPVPQLALAIVYHLLQGRQLPSR